MPKPFIPELDFSSAPVLSRFLQSSSLVRVVVGPIGSGKTTACVVEGMRRALEQEPSPRDFTRYFKLLVVRNTGPDLRLTTIPSYQEIFPEHTCGPVVFSAPMRHEIIIPPWYDRESGEDIPGLNYKVEFIGLDKAKDIKRLLSYNGTMIYINEVREITKQILERGVERVGRYPGNQLGEPTFIGIIADTNPYDEDHYLAQWESEPPAGYEFFRQPPGVVEVEQRGDKWASIDPRVTLEITDPDLIQSAAGKLWATNPEAENLSNLSIARQIDPHQKPRGKGSYYQRNVTGKDLSQIRVYYQGMNGYLKEGVAVIPEYEDDKMAVEGLPVLQGVDLEIGVDIGGGTLNPAAVICQRHPLGIWLFHKEVICPDMGLRALARMLKVALQDRRFKGLAVRHIAGDPAGERRDELFETKIFEHLEARLQIPCIGAPSNDPKLRQQVYKDAIGRYIDGKPGLLINRGECPVLRAALRGRWHFKVHHASQTASDTINKNHPWSDVADAGGYVMLAGGEYDELSDGDERPSEVKQTPLQQELAAAHVAEPAQGLDGFGTWSPFD